jgi:hypothetical protein
MILKVTQTLGFWRNRDADPDLFHSRPNSSYEPFSATLALILKVIQPRVFGGSEIQIPTSSTHDSIFLRIAFRHPSDDHESDPTLGNGTLLEYPPVPFAA